MGPQIQLLQEVNKYNSWWSQDLESMVNNFPFIAQTFLVVIFTQFNKKTFKFKKSSAHSVLQKGSNSLIKI